jgi:hypothetical protein
MSSPSTARVLSPEEAATFAPEQVVDLSRDLAAARQQIDWFKRQLFGQKSERRPQPVASGQMSLGELTVPGTGDTAQPDPTGARDIAAHRRRAPVTRPDADEDAVSFFDETRVPVRGGSVFLDTKSACVRWMNCSTVTAAMPVHRSSHHEAFTQEPLPEVQGQGRTRSPALCGPKPRCSTCLRPPVLGGRGKPDRLLRRICEHTWFVGFP